MAEALEQRVLLHGGHDHDALASIPAVAKMRDAAAVADATAKKLASLSGGGGGAAGTASAAAALPAVTTAAVGPAADKLPDLFPLADRERGYLYDHIVDRNEIQGRTLLRFSTAAANGGVGAIELRGGARNASNGTQLVNQRIYNTTGGFRDQLSGTFTYHPTHGHIHFDGFATYQLRAVEPDGGVGDVVTTGEKISFCLLDVAQFDDAIPGSPDFETYQDCQQIQGISPGWNDVYDRRLPDQWVDVTNVPDGAYWLEVTMDPLNQIQESDESNNTTRIRVDLRAQAAPLRADRFEPNNSFTAATNLGTVGRRVENALSVHAANNVDYYRFTAAAGGTASAGITFSGDEGDLDLFVYDANRALVGSSENTFDEEEVDFAVQAGKTYYVKVAGFEGDTNPAYDLVVDAPALVKISATDAAAREGGAGTAGDVGVFTVTRTGAFNQALTVNFTVGGTAAAGSDYASLGGSVTLSVLETSKTVRVVPLDNAAVENNETVVVTLRPGAGYAVGSPAGATVTIADNDGAYNNDLHDQTSEAYAVAVNGNSGARTLTWGRQVHMFKFTATAGQRLGFDLDRPTTSTLDSYLRLFNSSGTQLNRSDNGSAPGEGSTTMSYLEYTFTRTGTYYVGVSGKGNQAYSATAGTGDLPGSSGVYTLFVTRRNTTAAAATRAAAAVTVARNDALAVKPSLLDGDEDELSSVV